MYLKLLSVNPLILCGHKLVTFLLKGADSKYFLLGVVGHTWKLNSTALAEAATNNVVEEGLGLQHSARPRLVPLNPTFLLLSVHLTFSQNCIFQIRIRVVQMRQRERMLIRCREGWTQPRPSYLPRWTPWWWEDDGWILCYWLLMPYVSEKAGWSSQSLGTLSKGNESFPWPLIF